MGDYKRMVSYLYSYESGVKKTNVGYARIEIKNMECKITIHFRLLSMVSPLKAYVFYRDRGKIVNIYLADVKIGNGVAECRITTPTEDIKNTKKSFNDLGGIIVFSSLEKYFATEWDNSPISLSKFYEWQPSDSYIEPKVHELPKVELERVESSKKEIQEIEVKPEKTEVHEIEVEPMKEVEVIPQQKREIIGKVSEIQDDETSKKEQPSEEEIPFGDIVLAAEIKKKESLWDKILGKFPRMYPFEDDEIDMCVRIEPQDIGMLPMEYWVLGNNSFVLHGYYNHRHLIFAKVTHDSKECYYLGVPGIFHNRDQNVAKMFGFVNFKTIRDKQNVMGEYGYWMREISIAPHL